MADKIYTFCENVTINAGLNVQYDFHIAANNRELKIRSITLDQYLINNTSGKRVPIEQNTELLFRLEVGSNVTGQNISTPFTQTAGPSFVYKGNCFFITKPGQWVFDSFIVTNILPFRMILTNTAAAINFYNAISLLIEVEEKIIWNSPPVETFRIEE